MIMLPMPLPYLLLSALIVSACAPAETNDERPANSVSGMESMYPADCRNLSIRDAERCVEERFWPAFQEEFATRMATFDLLTGVLEDHNGPQAARLYLLRATINAALFMENDVLDLIEFMGQDLRTAAAYVPNRDFITGWRVLSDMIDAYLRAEDERFELLKEEAISLLEQDPKYNSIVLLTLVALPKSTGVPQIVMDAVAENYTNSECDGRTLCTENTWKVPYNLPGTELFIADGYARMGNRQGAFKHLNRATLAPGFAAWPQRAVVQDAIADMDDFMAPYKELGDDENAFEQSIGMGPIGCRMCHGLAP